MRRKPWPSRLLPLLVCLCLGACAPEGDDGDAGADPNNSSNNADPNNSACALDCRFSFPVCLGDVAIKYQGAGTPDEGCTMCDFSQVEERTDCAATAQVCQDGVCIDPIPVDPCDNLRCDRPENTCQDNVAIKYSGDGVCDQDTGECNFEGVEARRDCNVLNLGCQDGFCVDLCQDVDCTAPAATCDDEGNAVTYSGDGICETSTGQCDFSQVSARTDCDAMERSCQDGACVDLCAGQVCQAPTDFCQGDVAVQYTNNGTCDFTTGQCGYDDVETRTNCTDRAQLCQDGACVDLCQNETCAPPANFCQEGVAVQYVDNGACDFRTGECGFEDVETRTLCAASQQVCQNGACVDLCADIGCDAPEDFCDANTLVSYNGNGTCDVREGTCDFSAVTSRTDCTSTGQVCRDARCADLCQGVTCDSPNDTCQGDIAIQYTGDGTCDAVSGACSYDDVETRTNCATTQQVCQGGACVDLCQGVTCDQPPNLCRGDVATRYTGPGVCDFRDGACDFGGVTTQTNCATLNNICDDGLCVNLCAGVDCTRPANTCQGQTAIRYNGDGVCDFRQGQCDFASVQQITDCASLNQICLLGQCAFDLARLPQPGELVITEFMQDPSAVRDNNGEWFEIYNTTTETLILSGLTLTDGGNNNVIIEGDAEITIPGLTYFVLGNNADPQTNGGVPVDYEYSRFALTNDEDTIRLLVDVNGQAIDEVSYDAGVTFPYQPGASAQLGSEFDLAVVDNDQGGAWCPSRDRIAGPDSDFGTPGGPNVSCAIPALEVTVFDLSDESAPDHPAAQTLVRVEGLVVTAISPERDVFFAQAPEGGMFSGIALDGEDVDVSAIQRGDVISIEGTYRESNGSALINLTLVQETGTAALPEVRLMDTDQLSNPNTAEPWESTLVRIQRAIVSDANPDLPRDFNEFAVQTQHPFDEVYDGLQTSLRVDDYFYLITPDPAEGDLFTSLQGVLQYTFGDFKIAPRASADVLRADVARVSIGANFEPSLVVIEPGDAVLFVNDTDTPVLGLSSEGFFFVASLNPNDSFFYFFEDDGLAFILSEVPAANMNVIAQ